MKAICVFAGSAAGNKPSYKLAAATLGKRIAELGLTLIYGGGRYGLMGALANSALQYGGKVIGVITPYLYKIEAHPDLNQMHIVETIQERKKTHG